MWMVKIKHQPIFVTKICQAMERWIKGKHIFHNHWYLYKIIKSYENVLVYRIVNKMCSKIEETKRVEGRQEAVWCGKEIGKWGKNKERYWEAEMVLHENESHKSEDDFAGTAEKIRQISFRCSTKWNDNI